MHLSKCDRGDRALPQELKKIKSSHYISQGYAPSWNVNEQPLYGICNGTCVNFAHPLWPWIVSSYLGDLKGFIYSFNCTFWTKTKNEVHEMAKGTKALQQPMHMKKILMSTSYMFVSTQTFFLKNNKRATKKFGNTYLETTFIEVVKVVGVPSNKKWNKKLKKICCQRLLILQ